MINVSTNGCFDVLHIGHIRFLRNCKKLGDRLIVFLNSDKSVKRLKGDKRPINKQEDRREMLLSLRFVDEVHVFDEDNPIEMIKKYKPNIHVKSVSGYKGIEGETLKSIGSLLVLLPDEEGYSTTKILEKLNE